MVKYSHPLSHFRDIWQQGNYKDTTRQAGFAAAKAEDAKCQKNMAFKAINHFQPVAIETTGVYAKSTALVFLSGLAQKFVDVSDDLRDHPRLHQRQFLAVVRGNAANTLAPR